MNSSKTFRSWKVEGKYRLEKRSNGAGRFVLCSVVDAGEKRF